MQMDRDEAVEDGSSEGVTSEQRTGGREHRNHMVGGQARQREGRCRLRRDRAWGACGVEGARSGRRLITVGTWVACGELASAGS